MDERHISRENAAALAKGDLCKEGWVQIYWPYIHGMMLTYPLTDPSDVDQRYIDIQLRTTFETIPCALCRLHSMQLYEHTMPPPLHSGRRGMWIWSVRFHNQVRVQSEPSLPGIRLDDATRHWLNYFHGIGAHAVTEQEMETLLAQPSLLDASQPLNVVWQQTVWAYILCVVYTLPLGVMANTTAAAAKQYQRWIARAFEMMPVITPQVSPMNSVPSCMDRVTMWRWAYSIQVEWSLCVLAPEESSYDTHTSYWLNRFSNGHPVRRLPLPATSSPTAIMDLLGRVDSVADFVFAAAVVVLLFAAIVVGLRRAPQ